MDATARYIFNINKFLRGTSTLFQMNMSAAEIWTSDWISNQDDLVVNVVNYFLYSDRANDSIFGLNDKATNILVNLVPMLEQKNDEKGYIFQAGQCAALTSFMGRKMAF